jgi:hypothetical protein
MPAILSFDENAEETLAALGHLRRVLQTPVRGTTRFDSPSKHRRGRSGWLGRHIPFETIRHIAPAAALVVAAEYDRIFLRTGARSFVAGVERWDAAVLDTLSRIGFFDLVGFEGTADQPDVNADLVILPMRSGETADPTQVGQLVTDLKQLYPNPDESSEAGLVHLYGAMIEAVSNVMNHAYPRGWESEPPPALRRWWMTGTVDRRIRQTTAVVFDRGVSIPVSLPNWDRAEGWFRRIKRKIGVIPAVNDPKSDGEAIAAAVEEAVSSTGEQHRGTGLAQMRDFVSQCREGRLRIMSRCGEVIFRPGQHPDVRTYDVPIGGTLIEWSVLL